MANRPPDTARVLIHVDVDCFYAQVEENRNPELRGKPLAVTQKYLCVTTNYAARARGVAKMMGLKDAVAQCPELQLVSGEDLTPYRAASKQILAVLRVACKTEAWGTCLNGPLYRRLMGTSRSVEFQPPHHRDLCRAARLLRISISCRCRHPFTMWRTAKEHSA